MGNPLPERLGRLSISRSECGHDTPETVTLPKPRESSVLTAQATVHEACEWVTVEGHTLPETSAEHLTLWAHHTQCFQLILSSGYGRGVSWTGI